MKLSPVHVAIGVALGFVAWRFGGASPEGRVLIEDYVRKDGVCYLVRRKASGETTSTRVDDRYCS